MAGFAYASGTGARGGHVPGRGQHIAPAFNKKTLLVICVFTDFGLLTHLILCGG
jgi:hypothetical protein